MKKLIYLGLIIGMMFVGMRGVEAANYLDDDCLDDGSCEVLCSWNLKYTDAQNTGFNRETEQMETEEVHTTTKLTIYYMNDNTVKYKFQNNSAVSTYELIQQNSSNKASNSSWNYTVLWKQGTNQITSSNKNNYTCPSYAYVSQHAQYSLTQGALPSYICFASNESDCLDDFDYTWGSKSVSSTLKYDLSQGGNISSSMTEANDSFISELFDFNIGGCDSYLGTIDDSSAPAYYLHFAFNLLKYAAIILLFVLSVVEFGKAMASNKNDAMPVALKNTAKRAIIAVIIFFLPPLIELLFQIFGIYSSTHCVTGSVGVLNVIS